MRETPNTAIRLSSLTDRKSLSWLAWVVGAGGCVALALVVTHWTEEQEFMELAKKIEPRWLGLALLFQAGTYLTQGTVWRIAVRANGGSLGLRTACSLSLATLFVDQALPVAGLSGTAMAAGALSRSGMPRPAVASVVVMNLAMYSFAYASCMALAAGMAALWNYLPGWVVIGMLTFALIRVAAAWFVILLPRGGMKVLRARLHRVRKVVRLLDFVEGASPDFFRDPGVLWRVFFLHTTTFALDAATLWVGVIALGSTAPPNGLFACFMASTFFRTVGIMPGGLGTFETASVLSLKSIGVALPVGLSTTLLFRGLSFWLPMIPGFLCSRRLTVGRKP